MTSDNLKQMKIAPRNNCRPPTQELRQVTSNNRRVANPGLADAFAEHVLSLILQNQSRKKNTTCARRKRLCKHSATAEREQVQLTKYRVGKYLHRRLTSCQFPAVVLSFERHVGHIMRTPFALPSASFTVCRSSFIIADLLKTWQTNSGVAKDKLSF